MLVDDIETHDGRFRRVVALWIGALGLLSNAAVFYMIYVAFLEDRALALAPADRIVTPGVLMALAGGAALQIGMGVWAFRHYRVWRSEHGC